nr:hypothetical protein [Tanacetum cinerariifolium]
MMKCPQHYLTEMQEVILFYNGLDVPTRQILDLRGAVLTKIIIDAKMAIQEMAEYSQKWHNETSRERSAKTSDGLDAIQAQINNLRREIKKVNEKVYAAQVGCEQCKGPHYTKDCPLNEEGKTLEEAYYTQFGGPFQGGGYRAATLGFYQRNNTNPSRNQGNDLMTTIKEGEVIEEFRTRDEDLDTIINDYPSYYDHDKKIHIDFLEDMDAYRDEGMGDVIVGKPFLKEFEMKIRWFEGMITIYNDNNEVTYQMV